MIFSSRLNSQMKHILLISLVSLFFTSCAFAPWEKSAVTGKTPEDRVNSAKEKVLEKPEAATSRKDLYDTQDQAITELLTEAEKARKNGQYTEANALYGRVKVLSPNNVRAISGMATIEREQNHVIRVEEARSLKANKNSDAALSVLHGVLIENPKNADALQLQREIRSHNEANLIEPPKLNHLFKNQSHWSFAM